MTTRLRPGQKFGRLTVLIPQGKTRSKKTGKKSQYRTALCKCSCGRLFAPAITRLISGRAKSCGCAKWDVLKARNKTHGMTGCPEYGSWLAMKSRCNNPADKDFPDYGAKGITVTPAWEDFNQFRKDVGPRPTPSHSLDRWPNRDGNYEPGNVRWATPRQQSENRNCNVFVLLDGEELCLKAAARKLNFPYQRAKSRRRSGWPPSRWFEPVAVVVELAPESTHENTQKQEEQPTPRAA